MAGEVVTGGETTTEGAPEAGGQPQVDFSPVLQQVEQLGSKFETRLGQMEAALGQLVEPEPSEEEAAMQALAEYFGGEIPAEIQQLPQAGQIPQLQQLAQQQGQQLDGDTIARLVNGVIEQKLAPALQQAVAPLQEGFGRLQSQHDADRIVREVPELADVEKAKPILERAAARAQSLGAQMTPEHIIETYKLMKYDQLVAGEVPVEQLLHADLEPGSGASPHGGAAGSTLAQQMKAARGGSAFWGT